MNSLFTREYAQEMLNILCSYFGLRKVQLRWNVRLKNAYANYSRNYIKIGPRSWINQEAAMCHEFAHILADSRKDGGQAHHGEWFQRALWHVAEAWYGNVSKYPWASEYPRVRDYGTRRLRNEVLE